MASLSAINAVCAGLAQYLSRAHQLSPIKDISCAFSAVGATELKKLDGKDTTCSIFLYRVSHNAHTRNQGASPRLPLALDLHLAFTVWADSALKEHTVLAWVMRELYRKPVLDRSILAASGGFAPPEVVQLLPEELSLDEMTKLWQLLNPPYRPSVGYVAHNVKIGPDEAEGFEPVVATRFSVTDEMEAG